MRDYSVGLGALNMFKMNNGTRRALRILNCGKEDFDACQSTFSLSKLNANLLSFLIKKLLSFDFSRSKHKNLIRIWKLMFSLNLFNIMINTETHQKVCCSWGCVTVNKHPNKINWKIDDLNINLEAVTQDWSFPDWWHVRM